MVKDQVAIWYYNVIGNNTSGGKNISKDDVTWYRINTVLLKKMILQLSMKTCTITLMQSYIFF